VNAERAVSITEAARRALDRLEDEPEDLDPSGTPLGVDLAAWPAPARALVSLCSWSLQSPEMLATCERPVLYGPQLPNVSHGICDTCRATAFPKRVKS
jgi:hypothetical protein